MGYRDYIKGMTEQARELNSLAEAEELDALNYVADAFKDAYAVEELTGSDRVEGLLYKVKFKKDAPKVAFTDEFKVVNDTTIDGERTVSLELLYKADEEFFKKIYSLYVATNSRALKNKTSFEAELEKWKKKGGRKVFYSQYLTAEKIKKTACHYSAVKWGRR